MVHWCRSVWFDLGLVLCTELSGFMCLGWLYLINQSNKRSTHCCYSDFNKIYPLHLLNTFFTYVLNSFVCFLFLFFVHHRWLLSHPSPISIWWSATDGHGQLWVKTTDGTLASSRVAALPPACLNETWQWNHLKLLRPGLDPAVLFPPFLSCPFTSLKASHPRTIPRELFHNVFCPALPYCHTLIFNRTGINVSLEKLSVALNCCRMYRPWFIPYWLSCMKKFYKYPFPSSTCSLVFFTLLADSWPLLWSVNRCDHNPRS